MIMPFSNNPAQKFNVSISEIDYQISATWNTLYEFWTIDIVSDDFAVKGISIVAGIDILRAFPDAPFKLISNNVSDPQRYNLDLFKLEVIL